MTKKIVCLTVLVILTISTLAVGSNQYNKKVQRTVEAARIEFKKAEIKKEQIAKEQEKERIQEEQRIYNKNKGKELNYIPIGDSISLGSFSTTKDKRFVSVLSDKIKSKLGYDVKINDKYAKSGSGLRDNGLPNLEHVIANKPDLITIEFGTNDMTEDLINAYSTPDDFEENLSSIVKNIQKELGDKTTIILVTTWYNTEKSPIYDEKIKSVGEEYDVPVVDIQSVWKGRTDTYGPKGEKLENGTVSDGWHPNDKGHKEIADSIFSVAYDLLK